MSENRPETSLEMRVTLGVIVATVTGLSALILKASGQSLFNRFMKTKTPLLNGNEGGMALITGITTGVIAGSFAENILRPKSPQTPDSKVSEVAARENLEVDAEANITR
ncbi:MAG: hypothetical protein ACOYJ2_08540 [Rickettsiales bacterium]